LPYIIIISFFYAVSIPFFFAYIFIKNRKDPRNPAFRKRFGALVKPYKSKFYFWELVLILKKSSFFVVNQMGFLSDNYITRFSTSICLLACFGALEVYLEPYDSKPANLLNLTWNIILLMVLLCQGLIFEPAYSSTIYSIFGIYIMTIVIGTIFIVIYYLLRNWRFAEENKVYAFSKHILEKLSEDARKQLIWAISDSMMTEHGSLVLAPSKISNIVSKQEIENIRNLIRVGHPRIEENHTKAEANANFVSI
jgi:hypothetical protein